jgi:nicotinate-nucleotide adenylyltransferase
MKIGLFGGSFNPPHMGHINAISSILKENLVDEIFVFANITHYKKNLIPLNHREEMLKLALQEINSPRIKLVSNATMPFEVSNPSSLYIYQQFKKHFPAETFYLIGGSDLLLELDKWKNPEEILKTIKFLIIPRAGYPIKTKREDWLYLPKEIEPACSSTKIRNLLKDKNYNGQFLPKNVFKYIKSNCLDKFEKL